MTRLLGALLLSATCLGALPARASGDDAAAAEIAALRAQVEALSARLAALEGARNEMPVAPAPAAAPAPAPVQAETRFRGAPTITAPGGWSFKPRGRIQYDAGWVSSPPGIFNPGLGFSNELRRARLGVEGTMPGGFGYVFELDFADNEVEVIDANLTYRASPTTVLTIGQHNNFQGLEELTSSRFTSFIERAAFTDAFAFERRVGVSLAYARGPLLVQGGVFTDNVADLGDAGNDSRGADARIVYAPRLGTAQLHLGASAHYRDLGDLTQVPVTTRYRQRPLVHSTDVRFIGTPPLRVGSETGLGVEAALVRGPFHAAAEAYWLSADRFDGGATPTFFGGYVEAGWYLTGETRGYRGGRFDRTSVRRPLGGEGGGFGALQLNLRYDRLDLVSAGVSGGTQDGLLASLIWIPQDYVRFMLNAGRLDYDQAMLPAAGGRRDYGVSVLAARAQIDF